MDIKTIIETIKSKLGIEKLKPMQEELLLTESKNVELAAPTGSGKTLAFTVYVLRRLGKPGKGVQSLVIVPSRELAIQVSEVMRKVAEGYKTTAVYGGHKMEDEVRSLSQLPDILVATPGRLLDHLNRGQLSLDRIKTLVLDEYDKSLEMGFEKEMNSISTRITKPEYVVLTSATLLNDKLPGWLDNRPFVEFNHSAHERPTIEKIHIESPSRDKADTLADLLLALPQDTKTVVFVNHRESADRIYSFLRKKKIDAALYHGALDQHDREMALARFENNSAPVLVATDLAGRGLDIPGVDAVVHYHLPPTAENWIHRNGRTARNGARGSAYIITSEGENIPEYVQWDRDWFPPQPSERSTLKSSMVSLHINAGKKEKISKGDIMGYLTNRSGLSADEIGAIKLMDHEAIVAVPRPKAEEAIRISAPYKLKNKKIRLSIMNN